MLQTENPKLAPSVYIYLTLPISKICVHSCQIVRNVCIYCSQYYHVLLSAYCVLLKVY